MKVEVRVQASPNERRRFLGGADITPMVELVSDMLDVAMMSVVEARLAALGDGNVPSEPTELPPGQRVAR